MKYFVPDQNNKIVIVNLPFEPAKAVAQYYTAMTESQETFQQEHPTATITEIYNMKINDISEPVNQYNPSLDEYKDLAKEGISELSLMTSRKFVSDYQFLNSQASLLVEDGSGIYSHEVANKYIEDYNKIGAKCRNKYYEFLADLEKAANIEDVEELVNNVTKWYDNL